MDKIVQDMFYLNSSYSKEVVLRRFSECLEDFGIIDFGIITRATNHCTTLDFTDSETIEYTYGAHNVVFKYVPTYSLTKEDKNNLMVILTAFVISIENTVLYEGLMNKLDNKIISFVGSYEELLVDIEISREDYKRYNNPFTLLKILHPSIKKKSVGKSVLSNDFMTSLKSCIRLSDKVYCDASGLYILLKNTNIDGGENVANKIKDKIGPIEIGIAMWHDSFIPIDLLSEVENSIYIKKFSNEKNKENQIDKLNKILDKAILTNDSIVIVLDSDKTANLKKYQCHSLIVDECKYMVLRNPKNIDNEFILYTYDYEDIAIDVINKIKNVKSYCD